MKGRGHSEITLVK